MSFGIFEAATADGIEEENRKKLAQTRLAQAAAEVDHRLGEFFSKSTSQKDYHDRVRLAEKDIREIVGKYLEGDIGFTAVAKKLEPHYLKKGGQTSDIEEWKKYVSGLGVQTRKKGDGFTFPAASGAKGEIRIRPNGEIVVSTLIGGAGGFQSVYAPNEEDLVKDWIDSTIGGSYRMSRRNKSSSRRLATPSSAQDALNSGQFDGWGALADEGDYWEIQTPDGQNALVREPDGTFTVSVGNDTPDESWATGYSYEDAIQELDAANALKSS